MSLFASSLGTIKLDVCLVFVLLLSHACCDRKKIGQQRSLFDAQSDALRSVTPLSDTKDVICYGIYGQGAPGDRLLSHRWYLGGLLQGHRRHTPENLVAPWRHGGT
jgi:hypothetical protein